MKFLCIVFSIVLAASSMPSEVKKVATNSTIGFASFGEGTRGGTGGEVRYVWDALSLKNAIAGNTPGVIYVMGQIDLVTLFAGSPGVVLDVGSWKTIIGGNDNAEITGGGLRIKQGQQVIIQNIKFSNAISYASGEQPNGEGGIVNQVAGKFTEVDAILCEEAKYVWIDHNEFGDDPWISDTILNSQMRHDGLVDIKKASNWITVSNNVFRNHNKNILVGHSDKNGAQDVNHLKITFAQNLFMGTKQRNPRVRFGEVHVLNNLYTMYTDIGTYGIGVAAGSSIYAERNTFINTRAWRHPSGSPNPMGYLLDVKNKLDNSKFDAVPSNGVQWKPSEYYSYTPIDENDVENFVRINAGTY